MEPPKTRYELRLTIHGNSHEEIENELISQTRGGYLMDSDYYKRDEFNVIGGRVTAVLEQINPEQTPDKYSQELDEWAAELRLRRNSATLEGYPEGNKNA